MNAPAPAGRFPLWLLLVALLPAVLAVSNGSLWIDEAGTARTARQPDWQSFRQALETEAYSDINMPFYFVVMWAWDKLGGSHPEWLLRAPNILCYVVLQLGFYAALRTRPRLAAWAVLTTAISPFVWYYLNEARPYAMQLGAAGLVTAYLIRDARGGAAAVRWTYVFAAGLLVLAGSSMVGVLWVGAALGLLGWRVWRREIVLGRTEARILGSALVLLALLGAYYVRTFFFGRSGTTPGETELRNIAFVAYELLGVGGLGPNRATIRAEGLAGFRAHLLPVAAGCVVLGGLLLAGAWHFFRRDRRMFAAAALAWAAPCVMLLALGYLTHVRLLGRHFSAALPPLLLLSAATLSRWWTRPFGRVVASAAVGLWLASAASYRWAERHAKDDVRAALGEAQKLVAAGQTVWWVNDQNTLTYYGIEWRHPQEARTALVCLRSPAAETVQTPPAPDAVFLSRPDVFDEYGVVRPWLEAHYLAEKRWQALTLWRKRAVQD